MATIMEQDPGASLLGRINALLPELSRSERRVASFLLADPQSVISTSVKDLAQRLSVSEPTIIRFCRTVGCDGFKAFKIELAQELAVQQALQDAVRPQERTSSLDNIGVISPALGDIAEAVIEGAFAAMKKAYAALDKVALEEAAELISGAKRVMIMGIGGSSAVLSSEVQNRLLRLSIGCAALTDSYVQRMTSATLGQGDVVIFVSSTGRPRSLQDAAGLARYYGAKCIGVTPANSALARDLDICLDLELTQFGVGQFQPNPMRYAQLFVIDCLAFAIAGKRGDDAKRALERGRASVASLHGIAPQQPIGD